ncbi:MAG TPA: transferrin receptor-like dimerization domain-containing protein [Candidatus Sulfotelmatobacter sp.]|nr:transferrin receptor-like dimerization domain-containing protein [Candidatus Sulfotelmatobacter sp.]
MKPIRSVFSCCIVLFIAQLNGAQTPVQAGAQLLGYTAQSSSEERDWEKKFQSGIVTENLRENMRRMSARPHHVGSPYDKDNADWILAKFKDWGFDAHIETFQVLFPTPKERIVELLEPTHFRAKLQEPAVPGDPTSSQAAEQLPTYNAYSIDGDVTAPLVYVNYGSRDDYEQLDRLGVSVKGAIVIARYGENWRGIKPKVAAEHGAVGCIIYSDPKDDGYFQGDDYPKGGWRPRDGVQRGSVMDTEYPGDPLTPGVGATADAKRLSISEAKTLTKIPVLPISWGDALPLLSALTGPVAPEKWRGALGITYHVGPGLAKVHLKVTSNWDMKPVNDVIATLRGSEDPDQWVIRGNHFDAWVNGADDPLSGMSPELEEARMLGELHKQGWNPKRTIIYCAWDGEEPGLLGSTEWVETHNDDLQKHAVAYINSDSNGRGFFRAAGSHDLEKLINDVIRDLNDPEKNIPVWERARLSRIANAKNQEERSEIRKRADLAIGALGDGSDYASFLDHAGISALNIGYGGENDANAYHSIYDDFYWYTHFIDTDFSYGRALAQTGGTTVMRLADADVIPFEYSGMAETIGKYVTELEKQLKDKQEEINERNLELKEGVFSATADPRKTSTLPLRESSPPYMNFAPLKNGVEAIKHSAERYQAALAKALAEGSPAVSPQTVASLNSDLLKIQRTFLTERGLPERPWFKHQLYAPGAYTGYGAKPIAAVREYMDEKKWTEAEAEVPAVAKVLNDVAAAIAKAADDLQANRR